MVESTGEREDPGVEVLARHPVARTSDLRQASDVVARVVARTPLRLALAEPEEFLRLRVNAVELGSMGASYLRFGADVNIHVDDSRHYYVNLSVAGMADWRSDRTRVRTQPGVGSVLGPTPSGQVRIAGDAEQVCLVFEPHSLVRELERHLDRELATPLRFDPVLDLARPPVRTWLRALRLVHRELDRPEGLLAHPLAARSVENVIVDGLLLAQPHNFTGSLATDVPPGGRTAVQTAVDLLEAYPGRAWSVGDLAAQVHLSVRALQEGFARSVGLSPMQYLRRIRLQRVRDELIRRAPGEVTVSEIASRWGFLHHGRFAAAYRERFGETPVQTLAAHPF